MGWDKGRYYTRSKKVNGCVIREYIGTGRVAELVARMDAIQRAERQEERIAWREKKTELEALDASVKALIELTDLVAQATLMAEGYHLHKRGEWRKRRVQRDEANEPPAQDPGGASRSVAPCGVGGREDTARAP